MTAVPPLPAHLSPAETAALTEFLAGARRILGDDLLDARLYGSRARGEGHEDSDLDVALVVRRRDRLRRNAVLDLAFDLMMTHGPEIAPLVIEAAHLRALRDRERRIAAAIEEEGIPL